MWGRLFEGESFDVVVVQPQKAAMALKVGITETLGEEGVVVDEAEEVHLRVKRTGLAIRLESSFELKLVRFANCSRSKLERVILHAMPGGIEDQPKHLRVGPRGPAKAHKT